MYICHNMLKHFRQQAKLLHKNPEVPFEEFLKDFISVCLRTNKWGVVDVDELEHSHQVLQALEAGGVDNWTWYSESLQQAGLLEDAD